MADILRIKRRTSGAPGAPASLANAELAFNEVDHTLYYGEGTGGAGGSATTVIPIGGSGLGAGTNPLMDGTVASGTSSLMARSDHVHPSDTAKQNLDATLTALAGLNASQGLVEQTGVDVFDKRALGVGASTSIPTRADADARYAAISVTAVPPATVAPLMDGVAAVGTTTKYAREDHVHPVDTSREAAANKGAANGYASLDATSKVPAAQLPSYVDDVLEFANLAAFPGTGATGVIYVAIDTAKIYRWSGSAYVEIVSSPGTTDVVPEGSTNLYYTAERVDDRVAALIQNGTGITWSYNDGAGTLTPTISVAYAAVTGTPTLGTMSSQAASAVAITGGTIDGVTFDCGTF